MGMHFYQYCHSSSVDSVVWVATLLNNMGRSQSTKAKVPTRSCFGTSKLSRRGGVSSQQHEKPKEAQDTVADLAHRKAGTAPRKKSNHTK